MAQITIRHATLDDLDAIAHLDKESNPHPWGVFLIQEALTSRENWVVAMADALEQNRIVGWLTASFLLDQSELELIVIDQRSRRQGLAKRLLMTWIEDMSAKGAIEYLLEVRESNSGAIQLYQSLGFENVGRRKNYYVTEQGREAACLFNLRA